MSRSSNPADPSNPATPAELKGPKDIATSAGMSAPQSPADTSAQDRLARLRAEISELNRQILRLVEERVAKVGEVRALKVAQELPMFDPVREARMFEELIAGASGSLTEREIRALFRPIFDISLARMEGRTPNASLRVCRQHGEPDRSFAVGPARLGRTPRPILSSSTHRSHPDTAHWHRPFPPQRSPPGATAPPAALPPWKSPPTDRSPASFLDPEGRQSPPSM